MTDSNQPFLLISVPYSVFQLFVVFSDGASCASTAKFEAEKKSFALLSSKQWRKSGGSRAAMRFKKIGVSRKTVHTAVNRY